MRAASPFYQLLNGERVGYNQGNMTLGKLDITNFVKAGQRGLGNGSCGTPLTLEKYQWHPRERFESGFTLQPTP